MSKHVVHCKKDKFDVYIGRPSKWGNPFVLGKDGNRDQVVQKYRDWLYTQPQLMKDLHELKDKVLACWCAPLLCHGHVLAGIANDPYTCSVCGLPVDPLEPNCDHPLLSNKEDK